MSAMKVPLVVERRPYVCPEEILPTEYSPWVLVPFYLVLTTGAVLEFVFHIDHATVVAAFIVIFSALIIGCVLKRRKLATFPCHKCGATPLEQSEDDENVLLICRTCRIIWVTNLTTGRSDTDHTEW